MVEEKKLSAVLSEFARTLITDFPIQGILDRLVQRIVEILPVTAAGVTLISEGRAPRYIAASDDSALRFEQLQTELWEGPCLLAYESGKAVAIPHWGIDDRFPRFAAAAAAAGLGAAFTFPLRQDDGWHHSGPLGALDLYRDIPGDLRPRDMAAAQTLADVATVYLLNAEAREEARQTADRFRHSALHDALTGLPNRVLLEQRLEHAAQRAKRSRTTAAVLFADLDEFKQVNDVFGHHTGDELLIAVALRLSGLVRSGDTLARVSGDEFVLLCEDLDGLADVEILASRIDAALADPFRLADFELAVTASVGVAYAGPGEEISSRLLINADTAMYQAKRKGGARHQIIDLREALDTNDRNSLERDLRSAFAHDQLGIAYQPIVRTVDGLVIGVEALLRWTHPDRGPVPALSVVGVAEQSGLITEIGGWVLERGCRDRGNWLQEYPGAPLGLAVNVSARQLMSPGFCGHVASTLAKTGMDPTALTLEMTEDILIEDSARARTVLADLKELGVRIALDDFGTGYSSLSYLRRLPIDILKIDQGFVSDIGHTNTGAAIVEAVTSLAHILGLTVIAEGVQTQSQHDKVNLIGCESAQGFFYARPMPTSEISAQFGALPTGRPHLPPRTAR